MKRYRRTLGTAAVTAATVVITAGPASADPAVTLALFAVAEVWLDATTATSATVCAEGWVDHGTPLSGQWSFRVAGTTTLHTDSRAGATFPTRCHTFTTSGTAAGAADASLVYLGVGGDVIADCTVLIEWSPLRPIDSIASACTGIPTPTPAP